MKSVAGAVRPHWQLCSQEIESLGREGLDRRSAAIGKLVHENGTTFQVDGDANEQPRPWQLASVPSMIDAESWKTVEAGLQQRTRLLSAVLHDLLGEQRLLRDHIVPPEVLWSNPNFQRSYYGLKLSTHPLHITATEISRDLNGNWLVQSDRTRAPSGLGYLLENRVITSRLYPQLIRETKTRRIADFFNSLRDHVRSLAPRERDNPRVALLTPTTGNYRQFEDAYLARYLGFTLVKGADLAVRSGELNLKTLGGLLPIQVLWRHVSDRNCDPLELAPDSTDGVTGLMRVLRSGRLALTNGLGSVLAEAPALMPYLSAACDYFFKEPLLLPNVQTYWCGNPSDLQFVKANLDQLLIRPAFKVVGEPPVSALHLSAAARNELLAAIDSRPQDYIAQQRPTYSTTPIWNNEKLEPWHVSMRCFQLNTGDRIEVLPGALARVSDDENDLDQTPASGRLTQDCWIIGDRIADEQLSLLHPESKPLELRRSGDELPSRVAEHLFWMARYAERAEAIARLLRTVFLRLGGERNSFQLPELPRLVSALAALGQIDPDYAVDSLGQNIPRPEDILPNSILDPNQPRGLAQSIELMQRNATAVRDRLSLDAYRIVQKLSDLASLPFDDQDDGTKLDRLDEIIMAFMALAGITAESFVRTHARQFLELGRRIERADHTSELLLATLAKPVKDVRSLCESVLETSDSIMTYRSRYLNLVRMAPVIDLLVTDTTNPRSLRFQLDEIVLLLTGLPSVSRTVGAGPDERIALDLQHLLIMASPESLSRCAADQSLQSLQVLLTRIIESLPSLSDAVCARYLSHTGHLQTLTGIAPTTTTD
ncbi:MAG: circularly permuted type 2 ATP-grasp protein [Pirellulaceae bacterium]